MGRHHRSESALTSVIKELRRALGDESKSPLYIESIYGRGYRFIAPAVPVSLLLENAAAPAEAAAERKGSSAAPTEASVAVLAFANLTGDPANDYLSVGIAEEIITTLSGFGGLKVPARTSSFAYRGRDVDIRTIARELGVASMLEGSVRLAGGRVRVAAQLIEAATGFHVWAQNFDRTVDDLLALQDDITSAIGRVLKAKIGGSQSPEPDREAYSLYLQARALSARVTPDSLLRAIDLHERAIARDPLFARAHTGLAGTLMMGTFVGCLPLDRRADARARAEEAIRLERTASAPYAIRAMLDAAAGCWLDAEAGFRTAIELDDAEPIVLDAIAFQLLSPCGQLRRAYDLSRQATELAPGAANLRLNVSFFALLGGDPGAAATHLETARLLGAPEERGLFRTVKSELARSETRLDEAAEFMAAALAGAEPLRLAGAKEVTALVYAGLADPARRPEACTAVQRLVRATDAEEGLWRYPVIAGYFMHWQVLLGSLDGAFAIADRLLEAWRRSGHLASTSLYQLWRDEMRPFRDDPRFQPLVEQLGMPAFWEKHGPPDGHRLEGGRLLSLD